MNGYPRFGWVDILRFQQDWVELISEEDFSVPDGKGIDFYEKFREYIPASKLQGSTLWCEMLEQQRAELVGEIIS